VTTAGGGIVTKRVLAVLLLVAGLASHALAQDGPPGEGDPHAGVAGAPHAPRTLATAEASAGVPRGTIRVTVVDGAGAPVPDAEVNVGTMGHEGRRDRTATRTDAHGIALFTGLATGTDQAYRVNAPHDGATTSSTPFQLPPNVGYDVHITRLPVTHNDRGLLQVVDTQVELREDRAHIIQRVQLMNLGEQTYVLPVRGLRYGLPRKAIAFQTEPVMTDQRVAETSGVAEVHGSLAPGSVMLAWAFDVPLSGSSMVLSFPTPVRTYQWRVIADAPDGMHLDAVPVAAGNASTEDMSHFSPAEAGEVEGRSVLFTQLERTPQDPPLARVEVTITGLPTPGPLRYIAVFLALAILAGTLFLASGASAQLDSRPAREARRKQLLAEAARLGRERDKGEVGPKFFARRRAELVAELSLLLRAEDAEKAARAVPPKPAVSKAEPRASRTK